MAAPLQRLLGFLAAVGMSALSSTLCSSPTVDVACDEDGCPADAAGTPPGLHPVPFHALDQPQPRVLDCIHSLVAGISHAIQLANKALQEQAGVHRPAYHPGSLSRHTGGWRRSSITSSSSKKCQPPARRQGASRNTHQTAGWALVVGAVADLHATPKHSQPLPSASIAGLERVQLQAPSLLPA